MSKYNSIKVKVNGLIFDSQKEYAYWVYLIAEQNKKKIWNLQRQVNCKRNEYASEFYDVINFRW